MPDYDHCCDYAKSNRSKCRACKAVISKDDIRLAVMVQSSFRDGKDPQWHHKKCFFFKPRGLAATSDLHGFGDLRPNDQSEIEALVSRNDAGADTSNFETKGKAGKRRAKAGKRKTKAESSAAAKRTKASPEVAAYTAQSGRLWKIRDALNKVASAKELRELCEVNDVYIKGGETLATMIPKVSKLLLFGVPPVCDACEKEWRYRFNEDSGEWECKAQLEYSNCINTKKPDEVQCGPFVLMADADKSTSKKKKGSKDAEEEEGEEGDKKKKTKKKKDILAEQYIESLKLLQAEFGGKPSVPMGKPGGGDARGGEKKMFAGFVFAHCKEGTPEAETIKAVVEEHGGVWSEEVTAQVSYLLDDPDAYSGHHQRVKAARKHDAHVVKESFVNHSITNGTRMDSRAYLLGAGSSRFAATEDNEEQGEVLHEGCRVGVHRAAWKEVGDSARVLDEGRGGDVYHAVLSLADLSSNKNSYYKIQVVKSSMSYYVSRVWGRTGTTITNSKLETHTSKASAVRNFTELFYEKTRNLWHDRHEFQKQPHGFEYIETRLLDPNAKTKNISTDGGVDGKGSRGGSSSVLNPRVENLLSLIFDSEIIKSTMLEMDIDLEKFPLGALSESHIDKGYDTLTDISNALEDSTLSDTQRHQALLGLTNKFYNLIPHTFSGTVPLIETAEALQTKVELIDALRDMEVATRFIGEVEGKGADGDTRDAVKTESDLQYETLKTELAPVPVGGKDWELLNEWVQNTSSLGWHSWDLKLTDAFAVDREGEKERFDGLGGELENHKLLWHGSRTTNYVGILSQGLRIAPPNAPMSGYRFGKGIYAADAIAKSAAYCRTAGTSDMLIMACEVALGTEFKTKRDMYMEKPQAGTHSTHALGNMVPDPRHDVETCENIIVPCGKVKDNKLKGSSCDANEFIVYDIGQVRIRYLLRLTTDHTTPVPPIGRVIRPNGEDQTPKSMLRLLGEEDEDDVDGEVSKGCKRKAASAKLPVGKLSAVAKKPTTSVVAAGKKKTVFAKKFAVKKAAVKKPAAKKPAGKRVTAKKPAGKRVAAKKPAAAKKVAAKNPAAAKKVAAKNPATAKKPSAAAVKKAAAAKQSTTALPTRRSSRSRRATAS